VVAFISTAVFCYVFPDGINEYTIKPETTAIASVLTENPAVLLSL